MPLVSFAGCDYLGLRRDPRVVAAAVAEIERSGVGAGASRATTGAHPAHALLERELAGFLGAEAALLLPSGALANLALGRALLREEERVLVAAGAHASLREAVRLAGAQAVESPVPGLRVALTDGVSPSRGEIADLPALLALLPADGWLVVDDGHGLGVTGPGGRGSVAHHGIADPRVVQVVTLAKALGSAGGAVVGPRAVIDIVARGDLHVGSTALPPAWAAAARAALALLVDEPARHAALVRAIAAARELLPLSGAPLPRDPLPVFRIDGAESELARISRALAAEGFLVPHIRYPDGPPQGYLRLTIAAQHTREEIAALAETLALVLRAR
jgi:8-amino-7-oxononanoate synthase